jgi:isopenicillin-N N-acyltransferase-like protein
MSTRRFRSTARTPGERGRELGRTHGNEVAATVATYQRIFDRLAGSPVDLTHWGRLAHEQIGLVSPALAEEVEGIAAGAGLDVAHVAAVNARTEILAAVRADGVHECSTAVHLPEGSAPVAVQAWDWYVDLANLWFVWEIPHDDGHVTTTLTEYGIVGKIGVNTHGIGVLFNILHHELDGQRIGAPVHVLSRAVLDESTDLNQALVRLAAADVSASSSLTLVASRGGESAAVSVELNPGGVGYAVPDDRGLLLHTNHFLSSPAALHDTALRDGPDSVVRLNTLRRRLVGTTPAVGDVVRALDSHLLGGGGTCCHPDPSLAPEERYQTLATVVLDLESATLTAHDGGPCTFPGRENKNWVPVRG